ncbi:MAG: hypothetical protein C5B53_10245 [Candidatus Melainabacteria bacterium]|nr:MAG: hypothetical protein C5B53_10245 [Candidatus Melainabacteria bacterium]
MKYVLILIAIGALFYYCFNNHYLIDAVMKSAKFVGAPVDADNLEKRPVKPYAIPKGHCKAYFPGDPHAPNIGQELFATFLYSSTNEMMADNEMNYYLSEISVPSMGLATLNFSGGDNLKSKLANINYSGLQSGTSFSTMGNNEATQANNFQSDAVKAQTAVDNFVNDWVKDKRATIESRMGASLNGGRFNGLEILGHLKDADERFHLKLFCDPRNQIIIIIGVVGHAKRVAGSGANKFLRSLEMWQ